MCCEHIYPVTPFFSYLILIQAKKLKVSVIVTIPCKCPGHFADAKSQAALRFLQVLVLVPHLQGHLEADSCEVIEDSMVAISPREMTGFDVELGVGGLAGTRSQLASLLLSVV